MRIDLVLPRHEFLRRIIPQRGEPRRPNPPGGLPLISAESLRHPARSGARSPSLVRGPHKRPVMRPRMHETGSAHESGRTGRRSKAGRWGVRSRTTTTQRPMTRMCGWGTSGTHGPRAASTSEPNRRADGRLRTDRGQEIEATRAETAYGTDSPEDLQAWTPRGAHPRGGTGRHRPRLCISTGWKSPGAAMGHQRPATPPPDRLGIQLNR